jgi:hypothetical protein
VARDLPPMAPSSFMACRDEDLDLNEEAEMSRLQSGEPRAGAGGRAAAGAGAGAGAGEQACSTTCA